MFVAKVLKDMEGAMMPNDIESRIKKDISMFYDSIKTIDQKELTKEEKSVVGLSEMYAEDSQSYLEKGDLATSFSCISYAHGLLDAIKKIKGKD